MTFNLLCATIIENICERSERRQFMFEQIINVDRMEQAVSLFGSFDENIKLIEK